MSHILFLHSAYVWAHEDIPLQRSPLMGKWRVGKNDQKKDKMSDPALQKNPLRGRMLVTFMTTAALLLVFLQSYVLLLYQTDLPPLQISLQ